MSDGPPYVTVRQDGYGVPLVLCAACRKNCVGATTFPGAQPSTQFIIKAGKVLCVRCADAPTEQLKEPHPSLLNPNDSELRAAVRHLLRICEQTASVAEELAAIPADKFQNLSNRFAHFARKVDDYCKLDGWGNLAAALGTVEVLMSHFTAEADARRYGRVVLHDKQAVPQHPAIKGLIARVNGAKAVLKLLLQDQGF